jgi:hypothetical protein
MAQARNVCMRNCEGLDLGRPFLISPVHRATARRMYLTVHTLVCI